MQVKLGVLTSGKWMGKLIPIPVLPFLIGRARECHLRPASAKVGQRHCALFAERDRLLVRDFDSAIGTQVNGARVRGTAELRDRDRLKVGPLEFLVYLGSGTPADGPDLLAPGRPASEETAEEAAAGLLLADADEGASADDDVPPAGVRPRPARPATPAPAGGGGPARPGPPAGARASPRWGQLPAPPLDVKVEELGDVIVVKITTAELLEPRPIRTLQTYLQLLAKAGTNLKVLLSLGAVESMDSTFLGAVMELDRNVKQGGGAVAVCQLRPEPEAIFKTLELGQVLKIFPDESAAVKSLGGGKR